MINKEVFAEVFTLLGSADEDNRIEAIDKLDNIDADALRELVDTCNNITFVAAMVLGRKAMLAAFKENIRNARGN